MKFVLGMMTGILLMFLSVKYDEKDSFLIDGGYSIYRCQEIMNLKNM